MGTDGLSLRLPGHLWVPAALPSVSRLGSACQLANAVHLLVPAHLCGSPHLYLCWGRDWAVTARAGLGCVYEGAALVRLLCPFSAQHLQGPVLCLRLCSWPVCLPECPAEERGCCVRVSVRARVRVGLCAAQTVLRACSVQACRQHWVFGACMRMVLQARLVHACRQHCMSVWVHACRLLCVRAFAFVQADRAVCVFYTYACLAARAHTGTAGTRCRHLLCMFVDAGVPVCAQAPLTVCRLDVCLSVLLCARGCRGAGRA